MGDLATALAKAGTRLQESAKNNKRMSEAYRRQARADYRALEELQEACAEAGIVLKITQTKESQ